jgi:hypothetical protein
MLQLEGRVQARRGRIGRTPQGRTKAREKPTSEIGRYEAEYEGVMERHITEKLRRTADVRARYYAQMTEVSHSALDIDAQTDLQEQLQASMELEVSQMTKMMDVQRTQELSSLKQRL